MPTNRKRRSRVASGLLSSDQEAHLCDGWCLDGSVPWYGKPGFPFRSPEHRREAWEANKAHLAAKYPDCDFAAAADYDGAQVDWDRFPAVWAHLADSASPRLADVVNLAEAEEAEE